MDTRILKANHGSEDKSTTHISDSAEDCDLARSQNRGCLHVL